MKPSYSKRAENNGTERISNSGRYSRAEDKKECERHSLSHPGEYQLGEQLYVGATSIIYWARRRKCNQPVILEMLKDRAPGPEAFEQFGREYELTYGLHALTGTEPDLESVVGVYALERVRHRLAMVLEDFGGESLTRLKLAGKLELAEFLQLAMKITECLSSIHQRHLVHKNITPSNLVLNQTTGLIKINDFGITTVLPPEQIRIPQPTLLEGTLAYFSPEQSRRVHREVVYRSGLYSLGISLYELLTGHLPFDDQNTLELVYSHLVRQPVSPHAVNRSIPKPPADLVLKLLDKDEASDQYQAAIQGAWKEGYVQDETPSTAKAPLTRPLPLAGTTEVHLWAEGLDIPTLLKAAQAISSEVRVEELSKKLLRFVLENAGAEKGVLLLEEQGRWAIGAIGWPDHVESCLGQSQYLEDTEEVPTEVIQYVERAHEAVALSDATNQGYFTKAPYIISHQCKSIVSLPLLNQGRLNGILYLENNLLAGAFTEDHMELLRWFSAQIASSIDNARLYQQLERKVEERTQALKEEMAERERIEQALRQQEHLFRTLVEHSPDIIARYDRDLHCLYMNPTVEAATGRTAQEFIGHTLLELGVPEQRYALWERALRKVFETGRSERLFEFDVPAPDRTRHYQSHFVPEFAEDGSVASILSITSDITELKQAEETAHESERFARSIFDALFEQICVLDETGTIVAVNQVWRKFAEDNPLVPGSADEGANYLAMCEAATGSAAQEAQAFAAGIRSVISGERNEFRMEYPCKNPTEPRWFAGRVTRIPGEGPVRLVVAHEDITEGKWIEQALRESIELAETAQHEAEIAERREEQRRQEAEQRRQIAESLREIVSILNSNHPLDEVLDYILFQACGMLDSQAAVVYCVSDKTGEVIVQAAQGLPGDSLSKGILSSARRGLEQTFLTPWLVTIPDIAALVISQDDSNQEIQDLLVLAPPVDAYRALLAAPILINDEIYGRLRLYYRDPHVFADEEAELAVMFSDQIALAIETARLRDQAKQAAVVDERNRLARDLHDSVTQTIFSAHLIAEALPRVWERQVEEGQRGLEKLHRLIQGALAEIRTLLLELRPAAIVEKKLGELLKQLTQTTASQTQATTDFSVEGDRILPAEVQIALYRMAQETLNNILKHAKASHIVVKLYCRPESVVLRMSDNGCGFDPSTIPPDHLGMSIMRERAVSIGATFTLTSQPGHGTAVLITWQEPSGAYAHD